MGYLVGRCTGASWRLHRHHPFNSLGLIMQAIQTRYLGATNTRGSRIKAWAAAGSVTIGYPHDLSGQACHRKAAETLTAKLGWNTAQHGELLGGQLESGDYAFIFDNTISKD